ncbi:MAG: serine/threonine-protein kinase [Kofleriaceae bacterium]
MFDVVGAREPTRIGRYELLLELARGGMGVLYLARFSGLGGFEKHVAIKVMLPHLAANPDHVQLFLNEARIAARLSHPNVCQVFEVGEVDGRLYMVMEYLEGVTWEHLIRVLPDDPALRLRVIAGLVGQVCEGLEHAHELRDQNGVLSPVVHRDISPQNLFVTVDGVCKLLDFGVAKILTADSVTRTGSVKGKLSFMSPEQVRGESLDTRSDVFSLGIVVWEALTDRPLFTRETDFATMTAITASTAPAISTTEPRYGSDVDTIVSRALEHQRERRYRCVRTFGDDLRKLGAATTTELAALVRSTCAHALETRAACVAKRESELERETDGTTTTKNGPVLRDETAWVRPPLPTRGPKVVGGAVFALIGLTVIVMYPRPPAAPSEVRRQPTRASSIANKDSFSKDAGILPVIKLPEPTVHAQQPRPVARKMVAPASVPDGALSVDARPTARIYIDGAFVDDTPLYQHRLAAGKHELRLVPSNGVSRVIAIAITAGKVLVIPAAP